MAVRDALIAREDAGAEMRFELAYSAVFFTRYSENW